MEKSSKHLSVLALAAILMTACSQDFVAEDVSASMPNPPKAKSENTISYNVSMSEMKKYLQPSALLSTRAGDKDGYEITPIISDGDTVMYLVNFEKGWKLYSADKRFYPLLALNESSSFDVKSPNKAQKIFIDAMTSQIKTVRKEMGDDGSINNVDRGWSTFASRPDGTDGEMEVNDGDDDNHWMFWGAQCTDLSHSCSHKITTQWHQLSPYNMYTTRWRN